MKIRRMLHAAVICSAWLAISDAHAEPPRYAVEFLDRQRLEVPSDLFPQASELYPQGGAPLFFATVSNNGRFVAGLVGEVTTPGRIPLQQIPFIWDRTDDSVTFIDEIIGRIGYVVVNNSGHIVTNLRIVGVPSRNREVIFWSPETGRINYGLNSLLPDFFGITPIHPFNDNDQVIVRDVRDLNFSNSTSLLWHPPTNTRTPITFAGASDRITATSVNNLGQVVGRILVGDDFTFDVRAFLWDAVNGLVILPDLGRTISTGQLFASAWSINDDGNIVGETIGVGRAQAGLFWADPSTTPVELPCGPPIERNCRALWINGQGRAYGFEESDESQIRQHIWDDGEPFLFSDLYINPSTVCDFFSVSDAGEIAGVCGLFDTQAGEFMSGPALIVPVVSPELTITSPVPGQEVPEGQVTVQGVATDDEQVVNVIVNDIDAVLTSTGNPDDLAEVSFNVPLLFEPGPQTIAATAIDNDGNASNVSFQIEVQAQALICDVNGDQVVDRTDIGLIFAARGTASNGPGDPRDVNSDGFITINDGRLCVFECTNANCASNP